MQKIILISLLLTSTVSFAGETLKVGVKGMVCAFCAQGIEKQFKTQKEIDSVDVSLQNKSVILKFKDGQKMPNDKIAEILKDAGYEASFGPAQ
jgi:mercuric ion binding protein